MLWSWNAPSSCSGWKSCRSCAHGSWQDWVGLWTGGWFGVLARFEVGFELNTRVRGAMRCRSRLAGVQAVSG